MLGPKKFQDRRTAASRRASSRLHDGKSASGSVTINLDDYAFLTTAILKVKGVPLLYLPVFYYPIQEDGRATGFLIPTYSSSTLRADAQQCVLLVSGAAMTRRSYHHWFKLGRDPDGGEYRYLGPDSDGNFARTFSHRSQSGHEQRRRREQSRPARAAIPQRRHDQRLPFVLASRQRRLLLQHRHAAGLPAGHRPGPNRNRRFGCT